MKRIIISFSFFLFFIVGTTCSETLAHELDSVSSNGEVDPFSFSVEREYSFPAVEALADAQFPEYSEDIPALLPGSSTESPSFRTIFYPNTRSIATTTTWPEFRRIVYIKSKFPNGAVFQGSGSMIGKDTVLTAGHCIFSKENGGWATEVEAIPARNLNYYPYGKTTQKTLYSVTGWIKNQNTLQDIGAIKLKEPLGNLTGWYGLNTVPSGNMILAGYPSDLPGRLAHEWQPLLRTDETSLYHTLSTTGGSSGSAITNRELQVVAVHAHGRSYDNRAIRITKENFQTILKWISS